MRADRALLNGRIITVDKSNSIQEAVAIRAGRILAVGSDEEIKCLIGPGTAITDLEGASVTPGFVDSHIHTVEYGLSGMVLDLRYPAVQSIEDIKRLVEKAAAEKQEGTWIRGVGWDEALLEERRPPTRHDIDLVSLNHPVVLDAQTPVEVANTYALNLVGAEYEENFDGLLASGDVSWRIRQRARDYTVEECMKAILRAQEALFSVGVTAQKEAGATDTMIEAYRRLHAEGRLKIRSYVMIGIHNGRTSVELAREAVSKYKPWGDDTLAIRAVKCSFDGSGGSRTAWLYEPWNRNYKEVDSVNVGGPIVQRPQDYPEIARIIHSAGFQMGAHCVGDQAIDRYLDAVEAALLDTPKTNCRHSVIHNNLPTDEALRKELSLRDNLVVEATSAYLYFVGDTYAGNFGPHRSRRLLPMRTMIERGIVVGNGCDWNTCLVDPLYGIYGAVTRRPRKGVYGEKPFGVDECVGVMDALCTYTWNSAYCMFWEDKIGSIEPGKYADIVVWDKDILATQPEDILGLKVTETILEGETVHRI